MVSATAATDDNSFDALLSPLVLASVFTTTAAPESPNDDAGGGGFLNSNDFPLAFASPD
jgi:hypothetical protein